MHRSTLTARLITSVIALVLTPIALILLSVGGQTMILTFFAYASDGDLASLTGPVLLQILGLALLILVVLTGVWSSAGLIAIGILSIVPLIVAVFPVTLSWLYGIAPRSGSTASYTASLSWCSPRSGRWAWCSPSSAGILDRRVPRSAWSA